MTIPIERDRYTGVVQAFAYYLEMNSCLEHTRITSVAKIVKSNTVKINSSLVAMDNYVALITRLSTPE